MSDETFRTAISEDLADGIVSAVRTSLGDTLRSVVYFTPAEFDVLYVRQSLYGSVDDARVAKSQLVELERVGFAEAPIRTTIEGEKGGSNVGEYEFTVRFHEYGFVSRVIQGDAGVLLTADSMDVKTFEDAAIAVRGLLAEA